MSIFDFYENRPLPLDKTFRKIPEGALEYEPFKRDAEGQDIFKTEKRTLLIPYILCLAVFVVLCVQLLNLQITHGNFNRGLAEGNSERAREVPAPRGLIYDRNGVILAQNKTSFDLEIYPLDLPTNTSARDEVFIELSRISQIPMEEIKEKVIKKDKHGKEYYASDKVVLRENIDRDTALVLEVRTLNLSGVSITKRPIRDYNPVKGVAPIIGYVGKMNEEDLKLNPNYKRSYEIGKTGLEVYYEKFLRGIPGVQQVEVDSRGRQQRQLASTEPKPGDSLTLTVDSELEDQMAKSLQAALLSSGSSAGVAVAMNPKDGQILGMVSLPTFDNNIFSASNSGEEYQKLIEDPSKPIFNRAVSGVYPSGSVVKPLVAAAALEENIITENTTIRDEGKIEVGSWIYPDWKAHGLVDVRKAIAESCNVFFYALAGGWDKIKGMGVEKFDNYLHRYGFGKKTGIDMPGEAEGLVPDPKWKEDTKKEIWYLGDTYHLGIGQGDFLVTPLQMATASSLIANGGEVVKPKIMMKMNDYSGQIIQDFSKEISNKDIISKENLEIVKQGMRQAVTTGSARLLADLPVSAAAKTGTAQYGVEGKTHAWMTAFAPYDDPQILMTVIVEGGGEGYATAGPVVKDTFDWYFSKRE